VRIGLALASKVGIVVELATTLGWSLINAIADDQAEAAVHVARKISDGPDVALGQARRLLRAAHDVNRD